jgi:hypothetical protein
MTLLAMSNEEYHQRPGVSASMLKSMARGWRTFEAEHITKTAPRKESAAMALGTAVHTALLEPERFEAEYVVCPAACSDRRTKAYKEWSATVEGKQVLTAEDADTIQFIRVNQAKDPFVSQLLNVGGIVEKSLEWQEFGVSCRMRFDKLHGFVCIDIKTCQDASYDAFSKTIVNYRYDLQAAHYLAGLRSQDADKEFRFVFIAVETVSPFRVRSYEINQYDIDKANEERQSLIESYKARFESGDWSEQLEGKLATIFLPNWFANREVTV